jgi:hypothetical protein
MVAGTVERKNPFVGPKPFTRTDTLYGRERETEDLFNLLISGRIVLMYAASGAGKTSLIQAALIPRMIEEGFTVLDNLRVNLEPERSPAAGPMNRYLYSMFDSLEDARLGGHDQEGHLPAEEFDAMGLDGYLTRYHPQSPSLLVFDQFEEILTLNPVDLEAKQAFFDTVGRALQNPTRWALFAMREDYRASLDPYVEPLPTRFKNTYRLDLLGRDTAIQVLRNTARQANVDFHQAAAQKLVENLSRVQVMRLDGTMEDLLGPFVEPVQLQVVGLDLFDRLPPDDSDITEQEIDQIGDVDQALGRYYARQVEAIAGEASPDREPSDLPLDQAQKPQERKVVKRSADRELTVMVTRNWFEQKLITPSGVRDQLLMAAGSTGGLANWIIDRLEDAHLVRKDRRRGRTWIELAHDRLVAPVRQNNTDWFHERRLGSLRRAAPWLIGGALAMVSFALFPRQSIVAMFLLPAGASVLVFVLSFLLTTLLMRQVAMRERSIRLYKGSRILGPILGIINVIIISISVLVSFSVELPPILIVLINLGVIGACMLLIVASFAGANALGRQIARLRLPHGVGFVAAFLVIFFLIFLCIGLIFWEAYSLSQGP